MGKAHGVGRADARRWLLLRLRRGFTERLVAGRGVLAAEMETLRRRLEGLAG